VLGAERTRVVVAPAEQFRLLVAEQDAAAPPLHALRVHNALVVTGLPEGRELELSNFFGACRPGRDCALEIGLAGAPATITLGNERAPIAALSDGSFLLLASTTGLAALPAAVVPANEPGGPSPWLTGLIGLIGLGVAAGGAGGGRGRRRADRSARCERDRTDPGESGAGHGDDPVHDAERPRDPADAAARGGHHRADPVDHRRHRRCRDECADDLHVPLQRSGDWLRRIRRPRDRRHRPRPPRPPARRPPSPSASARPSRASRPTTCA
jgi:hypothetical protein